MKLWLMAHRRDLLATAVFVVSALVFLSPAVTAGPYFGPYDLGAAVSNLLRTLPVHVHNGLNGDIIQEMIPWNLFDWRAIHHLTFPLWNPYVLLGLPQFANFQSSVLSLPDVIGYLFPAALSFDVAVFVKLVFAGLGVYYFSRKLQLSFLGAIFAGLCFQLSGPFANELGWPLSDVFVWIGWIFGSTYALYLEPRAKFPRVLLAASVAFSIYGGFPEGNVLVGTTWLLYFGLLALTAWKKERARSIFFLKDAVWGWGVGLLLSAPLWLPGVQLVLASARTLRVAHAHYVGLPLSSLVSILFQGYYGYPLQGSLWFGPLNYYETVAYIGVPAIVLSLVAVRQWRRVYVRWLIISAVVTGLLAYNFGPLQHIVSFIPVLRGVNFSRDRLALAFLLSVLGAVGLDHVRNSHQRRSVQISMGLVLVGVLVPIVWFLYSHIHSFPAEAAAIRLESFLWPLVTLAILAVFALTPKGYSYSFVPAAFLVLQVGYLLWSGAFVNSYSKAFFPSNVSVSRLARITNGALVGLDTGEATNRFSGVGVIPEANVAYRVAEFAAYDSLVPLAYPVEWHRTAGGPSLPAGVFVPSIGSAQVAKFWGVQYVLVPNNRTSLSLAQNSNAIIANALQLAHIDSPASERFVSELFARYVARPDLQAAFAPTSDTFIKRLFEWSTQFVRNSQDSDAHLFRPFAGHIPLIVAAVSGSLPVQRDLARAIVTRRVPRGFVSVADLGADTLYAVPGASRVSLIQGVGQATAQYRGNGKWIVRATVQKAGRLVLRATSVPGWHATVDGRPTRVRTWHGIMLSVDVPSGRHTIVFWYWPQTFTLGLSLAGVGALLVAFTLFRSRLRIRG